MATSSELPTSASTPTTAEEISEKEKIAAHSRLGVSFSGCGFLGVYHLGALEALEELGDGCLGRVDRWAGCSAGALVAAVAALAPERKQAIGEARETLLHLAEEVNGLSLGALTPGFSIIRRLSHLVEQVIEDSLVWDSERCRRVFVSITNAKSKANRLSNSFASKEDFLAHLMASCFIPVYAGISEPPVVLGGEEWVDGGLSDNMPLFPDLRTLTVSPFAGSALISPLDADSLSEWSMHVSNQTFQVNLPNIVRGAQALFPPDRETLLKYNQLGYRDAMRFLSQQGWLRMPEGDPV